MNRDEQPLSQYTVSFGVSLAVCSVANALLVVAKEKSPAVQAAMKRLTGHHWVTHAAAMVLLFFVLGWLLSLPNRGQGLRLTAGRLIGTVLGGLLLGGAIIMGFYLVAD
jgi:hypothetical protein